MKIQTKKANVFLFLNLENNLNISKTLKNTKGKKIKSLIAKRT